MHVASRCFLNEEADDAFGESSCRICGWEQDSPSSGCHEIRRVLGPTNRSNTARYRRPSGDAEDFRDRLLQLQFVQLFSYLFFMSCICYFD